MATLLCLLLLFVVLINSPKRSSRKPDAGAALSFAHLHRLINFLGLFQIGEHQPRCIAVAVPAATAQRTQSAKSFFFVAAHTYAAASASPAPSGDAASIRGGITSNNWFSFTATTPRPPSDSITASAPMALMRVAASRNCARVISARFSSRSASG